VRRAFTLIELLVIIGIMGAMVTVSVVSVRGGQGAARVKGATRDVFAAIRHARSTALVTGQPAIITYSTTEEDGECVAKVEITSARLFSAGTDLSKVQTLTGEPLRVEGRELVHIEKDKTKKPAKTLKEVQAETEPPAETSATEEAPTEGTSVDEILFAPIDTEIVKGMRVKVAIGDELQNVDRPASASKVSVFSNVDFLLGRFKEAKAAAASKEKATETSSDKGVSAAAKEQQEPVSVVWETNGRVEPHQVWVYADGQQPEDGLLIKIDRFGAAKVVTGDGKED